MKANAIKFQVAFIQVTETKGNGSTLNGGVPQRSVLGPHLFNKFQNDLFHFFVNLCIPYNYADDNTLSKSDKDVKVLENKLNITSQTAIKWFKNNFMKANAPNVQVAFSQEIKKLKV